MRTISFENLDKFIPQTLFEEKVLHFCKLWFNNCQDFTFYTSGSTGIPKPIILSKDQMIISAKQTINWLQLKEGDTILISLYPEYIAGAMLLVRAMVAKMNIILLEPAQDLSLQLDKIDQPIHLASFVPNQWKMLLKNIGFSLNEIFKNAKGVLIGGADLDKFSKLETDKVCDFPVFLTYGMTETVSHIAFQSISLQATEYLQTLPNVEISQSENGNLIIKAPNTLNIPIETQDLVEIVNTNTFKITGRSNRIINSSGLKVNPVEIENQLYDYFTSKNIKNDFFVAGIPDNFFGELVCIFVEGNILYELEDINAFLLQKIQKNKLPKKLLIIPKFIKTDSGKIDQIATIHHILE